MCTLTTLPPNSSPNSRKPAEIAPPPSSRPTSYRVPHLAKGDAYSTRILGRTCRRWIPSYARFDAFVDRVAWEFRDLEDRFRRRRRNVTRDLVSPTIRGNYATGQFAKEFMTKRVVRRAFLSDSISGGYRHFIPGSLPRKTRVSRAIIVERSSLAPIEGGGAESARMKRADHARGGVLPTLSCRRNGSGRVPCLYSPFLPRAI